MNGLRDARELTACERPGSVPRDRATTSLQRRSRQRPRNLRRAQRSHWNCYAVHGPRRRYELRTGIDDLEWNVRVNAETVDSCSLK